MIINFIGFLYLPFSLQLFATILIATNQEFHNEGNNQLRINNNRTKFAVIWFRRIFLFWRAMFLQIIFYYIILHKLMI